MWKCLYKNVAHVSGRVDINLLMGDKRCLWFTGTGVIVGCDPTNLFLGTEFWSPGKARNTIELYSALQTT